MASSTLIPNPVINDSSKRRKRRKFQKQNTQNNTFMINNNNQEQEIIPWKSEHQQQIYSSKLLQAIRHVRNGSGSGANPNRGRAVRETADRVLAVTAKGRSRWSRAILTNKLKLKFMKNNKRQRGLVASATRNSRLKKPRVSILRLKTKNLPAVQRKARVLGGLVPGCRKQSLPVVLEEATDYIPALEMQVKAMTALVELLSGGSSSGASTGAGAGFLSQLGFNRISPS